jgi:hypothetical protein
MMDCDYQVIDKDGKITNYIWDNQQKQMVEGKKEKEIPWWKLHEIADNLNGTLRHISCVDSNSRRYKRIVIEYEEEK